MDLDLTRLITERINGGYAIIKFHEFEITIVESTSYFNVTKLFEDYGSLSGYSEWKNNSNTKRIVPVTNIIGPNGMDTILVNRDEEHPAYGEYINPIYLSSACSALSQELLMLSNYTSTLFMITNPDISKTEDIRVTTDLRNKAPDQSHNKASRIEVMDDSGFDFLSSVTPLKSEHIDRIEKLRIENVTMFEKLMNRRAREQSKYNNIIFREINRDTPSNITRSESVLSCLDPLSYNRPGWLDTPSDTEIEEQRLSSKDILPTQQLRKGNEEHNICDQKKESERIQKQAREEYNIYEWMKGFESMLISDDISKDRYYDSIKYKCYRPS